jgi:hypothetical protein
MARQGPCLQPAARGAGWQAAFGAAQRFADRLESFGVLKSRFTAVRPCAGRKATEQPSVPRLCAQVEGNPDAPPDRQASRSEASERLGRALVGDCREAGRQRAARFRVANP